MYFFVAEFERAAKTRKIAVYRFLIGTLSKLTSGREAAVNKQISIQKDSRPSEFSRPLT